LYDICLLLVCCRSESVVTEKLLKEKEQIIAELMDEGVLLSRININVLFISSILCKNLHCVLWEIFGGLITLVMSMERGLVKKKWSIVVF